MADVCEDFISGMRLCKRLANAGYDLGVAISGVRAYGDQVLFTLDDEGYSPKSFFRGEVAAGRFTDTEFMDINGKIITATPISTILRYELEV